MRAVEVFLVDDHPMVREGIRRFLEMDDQIRVVGEAESAEEAIVEVTATSPKVVLMDISLPGMNGIEATKRLMLQNPGLRVIILSAFEDQYLMASREAGACGYILKTATQPEMVSAVLRAAAGQSPIDPKLTGILWGGQSDGLRFRPVDGRRRAVSRLEGQPELPGLTG